MIQNGNIFKRCVLLDRDGVINKCININRKCYAPRLYKEFKLYPHTIKSIERLKKKKFLIFVITNQPDIDNNIISWDEIYKMNKKLLNIGVDDIFICPHSQKKNCQCRKPKKGLINKINKKYKIDYKNSFLVGDRISDMILSNKIGCKSLFINRNYLENEKYNAKLSFYSIKGATKFILSKS